MRLYDWARARLPYVTEEGRAQWLLVRRSVNSPEEMAYYRAYAPQETSLAQLAQVEATRWSIEECFERAKGEMGFDHYEVRRWEGWHRHITLCLLAHAFLELTRTRANDEKEEKGGHRRN
jgi:SRSO17 transposase